MVETNNYLENFYSVIMRGKEHGVLLESFTPLSHLTVLMLTLL
jgi:hypothetical protein